MTRRLALPLAALCVLLSGCFVGPKQLQRTVDDWENQIYTDSPWMCSMLYIVPVIPVGGILAQIGDFFVVNPIAFWFDDAWDSHGTSFRHYVVEGEDGEMRSLLFDDTKVLRVHK
jgi:hypothetical protein